MFLIDTVHDLPSFREFINERIEKKGNLVKEKMEIYNQIK